MTISLKPEQEAWLKIHVESGGFASVEEAVQHIIDERIAEEIDDLAWAKSYVDEARAAVVEGNVVTLDEHKPVMPQDSLLQGRSGTYCCLNTCRCRHGWHHRLSFQKSGTSRRGAIHRLS